MKKKEIDMKECLKMEKNMVQNGGQLKSEFKNGLKYGKGEYKNQFEQTK